MAEKCVKITQEDLDEARQGVVSEKLFKKIHKWSTEIATRPCRFLERTGYSGASYLTLNSPSSLTPSFRLGGGPCHAGFEAGSLMVDFPQVLYNVNEAKRWGNSSNRLTEEWDNLNTRYLRWLTTKSYLAPCFSTPYRKGILIFNPTRPSHELKTAMVASRLFGEIAFNGAANEDRDEGLVEHLNTLLKAVGWEAFYLFVSAFMFRTDSVTLKRHELKVYPNLSHVTESGHSVLGGSLPNKLIAAVIKGEWLRDSVLAPLLREDPPRPVLDSGFTGYRGASFGVHASHQCPCFRPRPSSLYEELKEQVGECLGITMEPNGWAILPVNRNLTGDEFYKVYFKEVAKHLRKWKRLVKKGVLRND